MSSDQPSNNKSHDSSRRKPKDSMLSGSDSPSLSSSNSNGFNDMLNCKRSVVYHPIALMLVWAVEKIESQNVSEEFNDLVQKMFPGCQRLIDDILNIRDENGFSDCYDKWLGSETKLTRSLADMIKKTDIVTRSELEVFPEKTVQLENSLGRVDILITGGRAAPSLMVIEVGLNNLDWWKKYYQASRYMRPLVCNRESKSPMLLTVLTISNKEETPFEARLGMLLFVPCLSNRSEYRVILIWRKKYSQVALLSKSFSTVLVAASFLSELRRTEIEGIYKTLGPNCCRIGDKVLRAYDDRILKTQRRPDIYLLGVTDVVEKADLLCDLYDDNVTPKNHQFGIENERNADQMWKFEGRLLVISTPFHKGRHWAQSPTDFVPIIKQLRTLHDNGFVHGDIRGSNVVFNNGRYGKLIDFDFGGKVGDVAVTYPVGYRQCLFDGFRRGSEGEPITKDDDWFALLKLIFFVHEVCRPPNMLKNGAETDRLASSADLQNTFQDGACPNLTDLVENLISFLKDINKHDWKVGPATVYKKKIDELGWMEESDSGINQEKSSKVATGSPPNVFNRPN